jgi:hypothetical protein
MDESAETPTPESAAPSESSDRSASDISLDAVVDRLAERFPTVDRPHIEEIVDTEATALDEGAHVRDFIPVLVEHEAKEQLRTEADPAPLAAVIDPDDGGDDPRRDQKRADDAGDDEGRTSTTPMLPHSLSGN